MTKSEFFKFCYQAGFSRYEDVTGLNGVSEDDMLAYVEEYPVGDSLLNLARLLGISIEDLP